MKNIYGINYYRTFQTSPASAPTGRHTKTVGAAHRTTRQTVGAAHRTTRQTVGAAHRTTRQTVGAAHRTHYHIILFMMMLALLSSLHAERAKKIFYHPPADYYFYLSEPLPQYLLQKIIKKGARPAIAYSITSSDWLRKNIKTIKTSKPLFFINGKLSKIEQQRLHELLKALEYHATIIHILKNSPSLSFSPLFRSYYTISFDKKKTVMRHQKKKSAALFATPADTFSFKHSISVTNQLSFPRLSYTFISSEALSHEQLTKIKPKETVIFFFQKEKKLSHFLENW